MPDATMDPHSLICFMTKTRLADWCQSYGALLDADLQHTDDGSGKPIEGARLLWALCGRESSFGKNMTPRHEPAYDLGGFYWKRSDEIRQGISLWGRDFACSYGPLQILAANAKGFTPRELGESPEKALQAAIAFLRIRVLREQRAKTLEQICRAWNGGNINANTVPGYVETVTQYYKTEKLS